MPTLEQLEEQFWDGMRSDMKDELFVEGLKGDTGLLSEQLQAIVARKHLSELLGNVAQVSELNQ